MKVEKKLDKIINILYDPILLHWKEVSIADISALGIIKFNINWSDPEVSFILSILENDGYVIINNKGVGKSDTYSLSIKGVQLKRKGGFVRAKFIESVKQGIIIWGAIFALIISFATLYDFCEKHCMAKEKENKCCNCCNNSDKPLLP